MLDIKDSVAVITGGASGIGLALAKYWVKNGGKVVLGDVSAEGLEKAAAEIEGEVARWLATCQKKRTIHAWLIQPSNASEKLILWLHLPVS
jgi:NADP-dependent 3-hydroxy acid dehydrogenase YdfG